MRVHVATGLLLLLLLPACDGDTSSEAPRALENSPSTAAAGSAEPETGGDTESTQKRLPDSQTGGDHSTTTTALPDGGKAGSVNSENAGNAEHPPTLDVEADMASDCVKPGGKATITIRTVPDAAVTYGTTYSDGTNAFDENFFGGNDGGRTDAEGVWTDSWTVGPSAPPGQANVDVAALSHSQEYGFTTTSFAVARSNGSCD